MDDTAVKFILPLSISVNKAYKDVPGGRRSKSQDYKIWAKTASDELRVEIMRNPTLRSMVAEVAQQRARPARKRVKRRLGIRYDFSFPCTRPRDLANFEKVLTDALVKAMVILDDAHIDYMLLRRDAPGKNHVAIAIKYIA